MDIGMVKYSKYFKFLFSKAKSANTAQAIKAAMITFKASRRPVGLIMPL